MLPEGAEKRDRMIALEEMGKKAKAASRVLGTLGATPKNNALRAVAQALVLNTRQICEANQADLAEAAKNKMKPALIDRLALTEDRIREMADGLYQLAELDDPIGEISSMKTRPNGLIIGYKKVPLGVVAMIYESRPNVTVDAFGLTFKSGNAVILRGGSDAIHSNTALVEIIVESLRQSGIDPGVVQLVTDPDRSHVRELMRLNAYVDVIIPRGGAGLIQNVVQNSTVPVIETGTGNCHLYVDEYADLEMAANILFNAKTQRIGVCNACESLVVHKAVARSFIPMAVDRLKEKQVEIRADALACSIDPSLVPAGAEDWGKEYLDYVISLKTVESIEEAIDHINMYNTGHSEAIITKDYNHAQQFLNEIDAAAVYVNASTRFTDGFEFGFGAEIGISTQKIHARGPMGLDALTTGKYVILGNGQVRD